MPRKTEQYTRHPVYGAMKITSIALPTSWRSYLARVDYNSLAAGVRKTIEDHAAVADMLRRDLPADQLKAALLALFPYARDQRHKITPTTPPIVPRED